jgi:flagellar biosynthetic protein FliR
MNFDVNNLMDDTAVVNSIFQFMLIFARLSATFLLFPGFSSNYIFDRAKLMFALVVSLVIFPIVSEFLPHYEENSNIFMYLIIEILIGIIISITSQIYYQTMHFVGQIIAAQSGLASAVFFDPSQNSQISIFTNLFMLIVVVAIFASDTHHLFLQGVIESYTKFKPGALPDLSDVTYFIALVVNESFALSFKMSAPFIVISLAILTGSAMLARVMPSLQVFFIITPAQILVMIMILYVVVLSLIKTLIHAIQEHLLVIF